MSRPKHSRKYRIRRRWRCPKHGGSTAYGSRPATCGCNAEMFERQEAEGREKRLGI